MKRLSELRQEIDAVDRRIVRLLDDRAKKAKAVGALKKENGSGFYLPHREKEVLSRVRSAARVFPKDVLGEMYEEILSVCRNLQKDFSVAYLGPEATFTHQAARKNFGRRAVYVPVQSIGDVFTLVEKEQADYGVVPVENSTEGIVTHTLDMFRSSDLKIVMEINLSVHHCLLSRRRSLSGIRRIYSHPQALAQCSVYLKRSLSGVKIIETSSTAEAARRVGKDARGGAIASQLASRLYSLPVIAKRIEDLHHNITRFLVIGRDRPSPTGSDKTSILFSINDRVGALQDILAPCKRLGVNMTKIESRPEKGKAWNYIFYIDFEGHVGDKKIKVMLDSMEKHCKFIKLLGSYPKAD